MAISIAQQPAYTFGSYGTPPTHAVSFASLPAIGNYVVVIGTQANNFGATDPTGFTVTDNQGHTYTIAFAEGQGSSCYIAWALVATSSGTFTVTTTSAPGAVEGNASIQLLEVSGLATSSLVDLAVTLNDAVSYTTQFNVTTSATDTAEELVIAVCTPRTLGDFNASPSPAVPPASYTELFFDTTAGGAGYAAYRITSATGAQSINFSGLPQDGSPSLLVRSFRGAVAPLNSSLAWITA